jgi:FMN-dependent NADH-azoreductase
MTHKYSVATHRLIAAEETMPTLLVINSSPRRESVSRRLTQHFVKEWKDLIPQTKIIERDLVAERLPLLDESWIQAAYTPEAQQTPEQRKLLELSDTLVAEIMSADSIVLGVPMHNFSIPASLKAWIDLIVRAGKTFSYGSDGPKGLVASGKKVFAIVSSGGSYAPDSPAGVMDFQAPYLQKILGFIGLTEVTFIHADKQAFGAEAAQQSIDKAIEHLSSLAEGYSPVAV